MNALPRVEAPLIPAFAILDCDTTHLKTDADWTAMEARMAAAWERYASHRDPARYRAESIAAIEQRS